MGTVLYFPGVKPNAVVFHPPSAESKQLLDQFELEPVSERHWACIGRLRQRVEDLGGCFVGVEPICREDAKLLISQLEEIVKMLEGKPKKKQG